MPARSLDGLRRRTRCLQVAARASTAWPRSRRLLAEQSGRSIPEVLGQEARDVSARRRGRGRRRARRARRGDRAQAARRRARRRPRSRGRGRRHSAPLPSHRLRTLRPEAPASAVRLRATTTRGRRGSGVEIQHPTTALAFSGPTDARDHEPAWRGRPRCARGAARHRLSRATARRSPRPRVSTARRLHHRLAAAARLRAAALRRAGARSSSAPST